MRMGNFGCGYDIKDEDQGWWNIDTRHNGGTMHVWDFTTEVPEQYVEWFDFILVNHVLCTMNQHLAHKALINIHRCLKPGGKLQVIDMDLLKVFQAYQDERYEDIPIQDGNSDWKLCMAISGYGTRYSLYTPKRMEDELTMAGFRTVEMLDESEYDTRPKESLIFEATK